MRLGLRMITFVEKLLSVQSQLKRLPLNSPERAAILKTLSATIPAALLAHFLRLIAQGRNGVTVVRHGVCSGCHLRVASGIVAAMRKPNELHLCENCGSYLLLASEEFANVAATAPTAVTVRKPGRPRAVLVS